MLFALAFTTLLGLDQDASALQLTECAIGAIQGRVMCGTLPVPEVRSRPGRTISLNIAILKATGPAPQNDPIVPLQGGPGQGAVYLADFYARTLATLRESRDIVLIDVRGTGRSHPLRCDVASPEALASTDLLPAATISACRKLLETSTDLTAYTTDAIARDLDDVRKALGIERWNLYGTSYGTRLAQEYIRRFPGRVRTATMKGIAAPSLLIPFSYARDAQKALESSIDATTRAALTSVLAKLRARPAAASVDGADVTVSDGLLAEALRSLLYNPGSAGTVTRIIRSASGGDYAPAASAILRTKRSFSSEIALGLFLSVTCAEDIPRIDRSRIPAAVRNTFLGDFRIRQQLRACGLWPSAKTAALTPLVSDVPVLLFSGDLDPVTPPRFGDEVVRTLKYGRHVIIRGTGHAMGTAGACIATMMKQFLDAADAQRVDARCAATNRSARFRTLFADDAAITAMTEALTPGVRSPIDAIIFGW